MKSIGADPGRRLYEDYEQALFQLVMHEVAKNEGSTLLEENQRLKELAEFRPSREALKQFTEELDAQLKKKRADARRKRFPKILGRTAAAVVAICFVFFTAMTTVQAFRVRVMNFWMSIQPEFTTFRLKEDDNTDTSEQLVVDWTNAFVPRTCLKDIE